MKVLVITQYFYPENFKINEICLGLKNRGFEVSILTGLPNYPRGVLFDNYKFWKNNDEQWQGIKIYRSKLIPRGSGVLGLTMNYLSFAFFATFKGLRIKEKFDKVFVFQPSPITVGIPVMIYCYFKKLPYYFWVQDLWPESLTAIAGIKNKLVLRFFDNITKRIYKKSEKVLVQSKAFVDYIMKQGIPEEKIIYYPNTTEKFYKPLGKNSKFNNHFFTGFNIIFAGNFGKSQDLLTILKAAKIVLKEKENIFFTFLGDGREKKTLEDYVFNNGLHMNVRFLGVFPSEDMPGFFACADALILSLKDERIFDLTIPSKIQSYLACGKPILASVNGEAGRLILESGSGLVSKAEDFIELSRNILAMYKLTEEQREEMGNNGYKYYLREFDFEMLIDRLVNILK